MNLSDFDYYLPPELIAQTALRPRDHSRLLVYNRSKGKIEHKKFYHLPDYLQAGDLLFLNNSKVLPARLLGHKASGGQIEVFLLKVLDRKKNYWQCLVKGRVKAGCQIIFPGGLSAETLVKENDLWQVAFSGKEKCFLKTINRIGQLPLPPYIKRPEAKRSDLKDYQNIYARDDRLGSVAAPTAGLHFTAKLLRRIKEKKVEIVEGTLHVGLGTFQPIKSENISKHLMHGEAVEVSAAAINRIIRAKNSGRRIVAVGTTSARILESLVGFLSIDKKSGRYQSYRGPALKFSTNIFIYPGYQFKMIGALITNFHLPKSSLILLLSALMGRSAVLATYNLAIKKKYRFFSYGDAMLVV